MAEKIMPLSSLNSINNNMSNMAISHPKEVKISNGPGVVEKNAQAVETASVEARTSQHKKGTHESKATSATKRNSRIRSRSLSASSTDSYSSGGSISEFHSC